MAFKGPQSVFVPGPKSLELREKNLINEIKALGIKFGETQNDLKEIESRRAKVKDVKGELGQLEEKKKKLQVKCSEIGVEIEENEKKLVVLKEQHVRKVAALNLEISVKKDDSLEEVLKSEKRILLSDQVFEKLAIKIKDREEEMEGLRGSIISLKEKVRRLLNSSLELEEINKEIDEKEKGLEPLKRKVADLESKEKGNENQIGKSDKELIELNIKLEKEQRIFDKFQKESSGIMDKFDKEMKERTEALDKRGGLVSEKEDWIKGKEKDLRKAKAELEKFYNRKINHIII